MRIRTDDDIYCVDQKWLGPANFPMMGIRATYTQWAVWVASTGLLLIIARRIMPIDMMTILWIITLGVVFTKIVGRVVTHERPIIAMCAALRNEIDQPRIRVPRRTRWTPRRIHIEQ